MIFSYVRSTQGLQTKYPNALSEHKLWLPGFFTSGQRKFHPNEKCTGAGGGTMVTEVKILVMFIFD